MDALERIKKEHADLDAITNESAGRATLELRALTLFAAADKIDREMGYGKNLVKV